jgi:hypothetical protein
MKPQTRRTLEAIETGYISGPEAQSILMEEGYLEYEGIHSDQKYAEVTEVLPHLNFSEIQFEETLKATLGGRFPKFLVVETEGKIYYKKGHKKDLHAFIGPIMVDCCEGGKLNPPPN